MLRAVPARTLIAALPAESAAATEPSAPTGAPAAATASPSSSTMETASQAVVLQKILRYHLRAGRPSARVFLVDHEPGPTLGVLQAELRRLRIAAEVLAVDESLTDVSAGGFAVLIPAANTDAVRARCARDGILTLAAEADAARAGRVSVGFSSGAQQRLVIHLKRVGDEKHQLSSILVGLAEVVR